MIKARCTFFLVILSTLIAFGQNLKTNKSSINKQELIDSLKGEVDQSWIRETPTLTPTKSSFFNKNNESNYFVGLLYISGQGVPFTWDCNLSLARYLLTLDNEICVKRDVAADKVYKGIKISWDKNINGLIWFNGKGYNATIDNWHLFSLTDCFGNIIFPCLSFKKVTEIPNAIRNNIEGLAIIPFNEKFIIKSAGTILTTESGKTIRGIGYDVNNDSIIDIFSYKEEFEELTYYTRLYINVDGQWKCKWIYLEELCA